MLHADGSSTQVYRATTWRMGWDRRTDRRRYRSMLYASYLRLKGKEYTIPTRGVYNSVLISLT